MQKLIRRVRPAVVKTEPAPAAGSTTRTARRLAVGQRRVEDASQIRQELLEDLNLISECDAQIDAAQANKEAALARVEERMRALRINVTDNGKIVASLEQGWTRQSTTIDPKKYRAKVTQDQFFDSIKVMKEKAEQFLGQKELLGITDVVPATSTGISLKVRELKRGK